LLDLSEAMKRDDCHAASAIRSANQSLLDMLNKSALDDEKQQFRRIMRWHLKHPAYRRPASAATRTGGPNVPKHDSGEREHSKGGPARQSGPVEAPSPSSRQRSAGAEPEEARSMTKWQMRFRRRATHFVERLELARNHSDVHEVRALCSSHAQVIQELRESGPVGLRARFIRVHAWLINQPVETPTPEKPPAPRPKHGQPQSNTEEAAAVLASVLRRGGSGKCLGAQGM
jgi:hypothetical protein